MKKLHHNISLKKEFFFCSRSRLRSNRLFFFVLIAIVFGFESGCKPGSPITGKFVSSEPYAVKLVLRKNGTFRYTYSHIHIHTDRGQWVMSGDTLILDFDSDTVNRRYVWDKKCLLKYTDGTSAFVDVKCK